MKNDHPQKRGFGDGAKVHWKEHHSPGTVGGIYSSQHAHHPAPQISMLGVGAKGTFFFQLVLESQNLNLGGPGVTSNCWEE